MKLISLLTERLSPEELDAEVLGPVTGMVEHRTRFHPALVSCADARLGFAKQISTPLIQAYGMVNKRTLSGLPGSYGDLGVYASTVEGSPVRIERVVDPADSAKHCWWFRLHATDPDTAGAGAKRTEFTYSGTGRLIPGWRYVIGLSFRLADWRATTDGQLVWQIHQADGISGSPWLVGYVYGPEHYIAARYNPNPTPMGPTTKYLGKLWSSQYEPFKWYRVVIEVREDYVGNGLANVWMNGQQVVRYTGPLGYNEGDQSAYLKTGLYHWTNSGNAWDMRMALREAWFKGAYIAKGDGVAPPAMDSFLHGI